MAVPVNRQAQIDIHLHDLASTLEDSADSARTIERSLTLATQDGTSPGPPTPPQTADQIGAARHRFAQSARRLVQNVADCRASLQKLQSELNRLRPD